MIINPTPIKTGNGGVIDSARLEAFGAQFSGDLLTAGHAGYDAKRTVWNKMIDKKPGVIAVCSGVADVIKAVNFARENHLLVAVRGGGHSVAGYSVSDGGMVIDLSQMKSVRVDPETRTATVEGGATWLDVDRETQAFGLACAGGVVSDTGVGGLTLNGGLSWMRRNVGMSIDNLIGADMVLADGRFVHVSEDEHPDLFWAIRGGGGNFGIVTAFEFQLQELGPEVMFVACMYPREAAHEVMEFWVDFTSKAPKKITSDCIHWAVPAHPAFPEELHGRPVTVLAGMYAGPAEEGQKALQPLREVTTPVLDLSNVYPYQAVQQMFDPFLQKNTLQSYWKSLYLPGLPEGTRNRIISWAERLPAPQSLISIRHLGGALSEVPTGATAFGDRSGQFLLSIDTMWLDPEDDEANKQWTRNFFYDMKTGTNGQTYFNFTAIDGGEANLLPDSYGPNYERLVAVKTKYDPDNFFRLNANIRPKAEMV